MSAQIIELVTIRPVVRPTYDDTHLGHEGLWILDNSAALARWWTLSGRQLGIDDAEGDRDVELFCKEQHAQQMREHPGFMLPHGASL